VTHSAVAVKEMVTFEGTCDASAAVPLDGRRFAVADDEDDRLRIYDAERGGPPLRTVDLAGPLALTAEHRREIDLEAATALGAEGYWLSSHNRSKSGEHGAERLYFFATGLRDEDAPLALVGQPYRSLLDDFSRVESLRPFELDRAASTKDGLNIEALTAAPDGRLLIGFRSPVPGGRALLVPIANARAVMFGERPQLGGPILLDLGGSGVRGLSWWHGAFWIIGGAPDHRRRSRLYAWNGDERAPQVVETVRFADFNAEGFFTPEERDEMMVLSDDGTRESDGIPCKLLRDPKRKRFRGLWLTTRAWRATGVGAAGNRHTVSSTR
jgi:hypothetical protein